MDTETPSFDPNRDTPTTAPPPSPMRRDDRERLHELGYAQELLRQMGGFSNFAVSFTIISILAGCLTLYQYAMNTGGPVEMSIGWPAVGIMVIFVGLAMAEVCSSYPTAGGLYYWAAKLAPGSSAPAWSWMAGWFNLMGQIGITAGIDFGLALFADGLMNLLFPSFSTGAHMVILIYAVVLILHGTLNTFGVRLVALLNDISVWWHVVGVALIVALLWIMPDHHRSASFVFTKTVNNTGFSPTWYAVLIGLLLAQYTYTGYDASAHMTEETRNADTSGPWGIVMSIAVSLVVGWILLLGVTFAIQNYAKAAGAPNAGVAVSTIFIDATSRRVGELMMLIAVVAQFFCGMSSVTANSRMIYAFSRDGALPGSRIWHKINKRTRTPTNSIWLAAIGALILGLPYLASPTAYFAITSIAVIGLYVAYAIPIYLRLRAGDRFAHGPWHLGRWGKPIGWIAVLWVVFITVLFCLPQASPIKVGNFNYASVSTGVVLFGAGGWYLVSARKWFKGPKVQGSAEELAAIERELERV
jgi:amino acid permease (GABA permease)